MISLPRLAAITFGSIALSACGGSGDGPAGGKTDNSRILEGSVSDEMIPYEKLRSEPPAARIVESDGKGGKAPGTATSAGTSPDPSPDTAEPDTVTDPAPEQAAQPATED